MQRRGLKVYLRGNLQPMNPLIKYSLGALILSLLPACAGYHYTSPLVASPQFTDAHQIKAQGTIGFNHTQAQLSYSPLKHLGLSYTRFNSLEKPNKGVNALQLTGYFQLGNSNLYLAGNIGAQRANLSNTASLLFLGYSTEVNSQYIGFNQGLELYLTKPNAYRKYSTWSIGFNFKQFQFSKLTLYTKLYQTSEPNTLQTSEGTYNLQSFSPYMTYMLHFGQNQRYTYRFSVEVDLGYRAPIQGSAINIYSNHTPHWQRPYASSFDLNGSRIFIAHAFGWNFDLNKRKFRKYTNPDTDFRSK